MKLNKKQQDLVTQNHKLIYSYMNKHSLKYDDYYDILAIALCKAALTFDSSRGIAFSTYAYRCFFNAVGAHIRHLKTKQCLTEEALSQIINEYGITSVNALTKNDRAIHLYNKLGFEANHCSMVTMYRKDTAESVIDL